MADIMGMSPDLFSVLAGGAGAALGGPNTWQGRLGAFAGQMGQSGIQNTNVQAQRKEMIDLLKAALGGAPAASAATSGPSGDGIPGVPKELSGITPTPVGQPGPDAVTYKVTADGTTTTVQNPTAKIPTPPPAESQTSGGGQQADPFSQAVLSILSGASDLPSLKGLSPEQILNSNQQSLAGIGAGLNAMQGQQQNVIQQGQNTINEQNANSAMIKALTDAQKAELAAGKKDRTAVYTANGRVMREVEDAQGNLLSTEDLGAASEGFRYFESPDGAIQAFPVGVNPPPDFKSITTRTTDLTQQQEVKLRENIATTDYFLTTGKDGNNRPLTAGQTAAFVDLYNDHVKTLKKDMALYMLVPEVPGKALVPFDSSPAKAVKLPYDNKVKRYLTPADVQSLAKHNKMTVRDVLKKLKVEVD